MDCGEKFPYALLSLSKKLIAGLILIISPLQKVDCGINTHHIPSPNLVQADYQPHLIPHTNGTGAPHPAYPRTNTSTPPPKYQAPQILSHNPTYTSPPAS